MIISAFHVGNDHQRTPRAKILMKKRYKKRPACKFCIGSHFVLARLRLTFPFINVDGLIHISDYDDADWDSDDDAFIEAFAASQKEAEKQ